MNIKFDRRIKFFVVQENENSDPKVIERKEFLNNVKKYIVNMIFDDLYMAKRFAREYKQQLNYQALKEILLSDGDIEFINKIDKEDKNKVLEEQEDSLPPIEFYTEIRFIIYIYKVIYIVKNN